MDNTPTWNPYSVVTLWRPSNGYQRSNAVSLQMDVRSPTKPKPDLEAFDMGYDPKKHS